MGSSSTANSMTCRGRCQSGLFGVGQGLAGIGRVPGMRAGSSQTHSGNPATQARTSFSFPSNARLPSGAVVLGYAVHSWQKTFLFVGEPAERQGGVAHSIIDDPGEDLVGCRQQRDRAKVGVVIS